MAELIDQQLAEGKLILNFMENSKKLGVKKLNATVWQARLDLLNSYWLNFSKRHIGLSAYEEKFASNVYFSENWYLNVEQAYIFAKSDIMEEIQRLTSVLAEGTSLSGNLPEGTSTHTLTSVCSTPKLTIPKFNGKQQEWESFKELFCSLIKHNPSLSSVVKLQHLINSLEGTAANRLKGMKIIGSNLDVAWEKLCRRYDNPRVRLSTHLEALISVKPSQRKSVSDINRLLDVAEEAIQGLRDLNCPVDSWDLWFVHLIGRKLDPVTREEWEISQEASSTFPSFKQLIDFLENRARSLDASRPENISENFSRSSRQFKVQRVINANMSHTPVTKRPCDLCKNGHFVGHCPKFHNMPYSQRIEFIQKAKLCGNCLRKGHFASSCPSSGSCLICREKHHTTLHRDGLIPQNPPKSPESRQLCADASQASGSSTSVAVNTSSVGKTILMATAQVVLVGSSGAAITVRALLDPASEASFVSENVAQLLRLSRTRATVSVQGVGMGPKVQPKGSVNLTLKSTIDPQFFLNLSALVLKNITKFLPTNKILNQNWDHVHNLLLADPQFGTPAQIDCLLGADVYASVLKPGLHQGPVNTPVAQNTALGWVLIGSTNTFSNVSEVVSSHAFSDSPLIEAISRFWKVEEVPDTIHLSEEENTCEEYYRKTLVRSDDGRYEVRLPFSRFSSFPDSRSIAVSCFLRNERKFLSNPFFGNQYKRFMDEYLRLNHMEPVPPDELHCKSTYYLPHHGVFKSSIPKKIRVVFNASQKCSNSLSLNDCLFPGPKLQSDLTAIIIRWRYLRVVFVADIVKMYRQIWMHPQDTDWQRIVWRSSPDQPIQDFRLKTVTYGTTSAPYLAIRTLHQLAEDEGHQYPRAVTAIKLQTYVDDIFSGADNHSDALSTRHELINMLQSAGISLDKWAANQVELLEGLTTMEGDKIPINLEDAVSTLGLNWIPGQDYFFFQVSLPKSSSVTTKRSILSEISRLFDPMGWLAPFLIHFKILMQDIWIQGFEWDSPILGSMLNHWNGLREQLPQLSKIKIPRWFNTLQGSNWELHGFADSSERAYAAAVYIVVFSDDGCNTSSLILAKTKLAPIKTQTLPKLELCGALLLTRLIHFLLTSHLPSSPAAIHCWTDSKVTLAWLRGHPSRWKTFIANRVSEIITTLPNATWHHVCSSDNAADCATRGYTVMQLKDSNLWWKGPSWLVKEHVLAELPYDAFHTNEEERSPSYTIATVQDESFLSYFKNFSSIKKIFNIISYCLRWKCNATSIQDHRIRGPLTEAERAVGKIALFRLVQAASFGKEISCLHRDQELPRRSPLRYLLPFIDEKGLLRVGGRLQNSQFLNKYEKHPIILPKDSFVSRLLVEESHLMTLHGGPQLMLSHLYRQYWIVRGKQLAYQVSRQCVRCARFSSKPFQQQMAPLPDFRVNVVRPFSHTGVDYLGPIAVRTSKGRGTKSYKGYVAIFICMVIKAVHIEVVSDCTTMSFLAAYRRFVARRGHCSVIYSDNGTQFHGADAELRRLFDATSTLCTEFANEVAKDGTKWVFIPPRAPHFGGLWEASVKSFKFHFKRVIGNTQLTFEELATLSAQIEACLNSRPLCPISSNASDLVALTPGHFLIGSSLIAPPEPYLDIDFSQSCSSRWKMICLMRNHFWHRWTKEVLHHMQQRRKWLKSNHSIKVDDLVLLKDDLLPPNKWPLGRVTHLHLGNDGLPRVVTVKTADSELLRPLVKIIPLPLDDRVTSAYAAVKEGVD